MLQHPFFLPWRWHLLIIIMLLFWKGQWTAAASWIAGVVMLRLLFLYTYSILWTIKFTYRFVINRLYALYFFLFRFMPQTDEQKAAAQQESFVKTHVLCGMIIMLEGNICAGKSTLANELRKCPASVITEEKVPNDVLARFNETGKGMEIQMTMGSKRIVTLATCSANLKSDTTKRPILDRSLIGCRAMALWNYVVGNLSADDLRLYMTLGTADLKQAFEKTEAEIVVLYMPLPVTEVRKRLAKRPGPDQNTSEKYLLGLALMHALIIVHVLRLAPKNVRVLVFNPNRANDNRTDNSCACQQLKAGANRAWSLDMTVYDKTLLLEPLEQERMLQVMREILVLPTASFDIKNEGNWTASALQHIADQTR